MAGKTVRELVTRWGFKVDDRPLRRIDARVNNLKTSLRGLGSLSAKIGIGFGALSFGIGRLLQEAGNFEQVEIAFDVLTKSTEKAKVLMQDLIQFAVKTPFTLVGVTDATKQLLAYGIESENMIDTLTALGNVAAGVGKDKLPQLTLAFGQVRAAGRLTGQEARQFTEAGVPINELIAKEFGIAGSEVAKFVASGQVSFERFNKAFQDMANGTGRFTGLMEKQSKTLLGVYSNLKDAVQILAISVGKTLVPEAKEYLNVAIDWLNVNKELIQQNISGAVKAIVSGMKQIVKVGRAVFRVMKAVIKSFGGFENAVKLATTALSLFVAVRVLGFLGNMGLVALSAAKNLLVFVAATRTAAIALLSLKLIALAIPLLIGAAIAAMFLLIEDFVVFMQGGDSLIGSLVDNFEKAMPKFIASIEKFGEEAVGKVEEFFGKIESFLSDDKFADKRERIAKGIFAAFDVLLTASGLLAKIGFKIGQAIFDGVIEAFIAGSPTLAKFLGLKTERKKRSEFELAQKQQEITGAASAIRKFGIEDARKAFSSEAITKAQAFIDSESGVILSRFLDKSQKRGVRNPFGSVDKTGNLSEALADGIIDTAELERVGPAFNRLSSMLGIDPNSLTLSPTTNLPITPSASRPNTFNTNVKIDGSNLDEAQLERAVINGVNQAQMKTARDIATQAQSSIAE